MARNKRLHVELALIKLNYLQQAIELINDNGNVIKKKRVDAPVIHKIKSIVTNQVAKPAIAESKLFIKESAPAQKINTQQVVEEIISKVQENTLKYKTPKNSNNGKNLLESLRDKISSDYIVEEIKDAEALTLSRLRNAWDEYAGKLETQPNKHSTVQTFKSAKLAIETDNFFTVTVNAITQQKFIEQEKTMLCDFIQQSFNNRSISFKILVEAGEKEDIPLHLTLNSRQKFERIAEKYPLVRELKNRLNLDIDY